MRLSGAGYGLVEPRHSSNVIGRPVIVAGKSTCRDEENVDDDNCLTIHFFVNLPIIIINFRSVMMTRDELVALLKRTHLTL